MRILSRDDDDDSGKNEYDAKAEKHGERLTEEQHADSYSGQGFQGSHNGGRGCPDFVDSYCHQHEGEYRGDDAKPACEEPGSWRWRELQVQVGRSEGIDQQGQQAEEQDIERELQGRHADARLVDNDDIDGVCQRGKHDAEDAPRTERGVRSTPIKQADSQKCQDDGRGGGERDSLTEECGHNDCHHNGIDEQNGGGYACVHEAEALVVGDTRYSEEQAERGQHTQFLPADAEILPSGQERYAKYDDCHREAIEQDRGSVHAFPVERQGPEGIRAVANSRQYAADDPFVLMA